MKTNLDNLKEVAFYLCMEGANEEAGSLTSFEYENETYIISKEKNNVYSVTKEDEIVPILTIQDPTEIKIKNRALRIEKLFLGDFRAALAELNKLIWAQPVNEIEQRKLIINGESLPLNITPFHYCYAEGKIDEKQVIEYLQSIK